MIGRKSLLFLIILLFSSTTTIATGNVEEGEHYIVNSEDWRDVYSVMLYSNLIGRPADYLVSTPHSTLLLNAIQKNEHLHIISSNNIPFVVGYESLAIGRGFEADEFIMRNSNIELANSLNDVQNFIITDDSYGYNAIALAPYAVVSKSYVLFTDRNNINDINNFLSSRDVASLIIYGTVDREVLEALDSYDPEIINRDGDRFDNNIEIVKKYREINPTGQVILTNGEFIEQEMMKGESPVLFIGRNNVPDQTKEYIQSTDIEVGVLIGNELVGTATTVRRQVGISTFVKFAQGARANRGAISQVEALDMFYMPSYALNLEIFSARYNRLAGQLEITIKNNVELATYFKGTYAITAGEVARSVGDIDPVFITGNGFKTMVYEVGNLPEGDINVAAFVIYGESKKSLEFTIEEDLIIDTVNLIDEAEMDLLSTTYYKNKDQFQIEVENIGEVDGYADVEVTDILIVGERRTYGSGAQPLKVGEKKKFLIDIELNDQELVDNSNVLIKIFYGQRENTLTKLLEASTEIIIKTTNYVQYALVLGIVALAIFLGWKIIGGRRKKEY